MKRALRSDELLPGTTLPRAIYTRAGRLVAHEGTELTAPMAQALDRAAQAGGVFRADERVPVTPLSSPATPSRSSRDGRSEGPIRIRVARLSPIELRRAAIDAAEASRERWSKLPLNVEVGVDPVLIGRGLPVAAHGPGSIDPNLRERRAAGVVAVHAAFARLLDGERIGMGALTPAADDLIDAIGRGAELFAAQALGLPQPIDSLPDQAYTTGALAIGIAAALGWPRADVRLIGVAGFLCDVGMGLVTQPVRRLSRPLTEIELNAVRRHPELSLVLARRVDALPERVALAVYQHHERSDASGYPEAARPERQHDYTRILAVANAFAGMTAPRAHRPALTPQQAMSDLASRASGEFDAAAVRALLEVLGLFPAGSFVRLSTGHIALVGAGAPPHASDRPVVHVVQPSGAAQRFGQPIDLATIEPRALRVLEAVRAPEGLAV